ncbi:exodeoxyribonuclease VII small subunit [Kineosporia sp. A_224]|uniref:exodeoxyribonuclease VII small subunit n=1 Tax=Kineosporia sp. A_224 TaxID=1962180 RepID=UPI000B4AD22B|nr:exodeoxyribonuclease VII small subunit [Kineosporia sp. A_224]
MTTQPDPQTLGYEQARDELVDVVRRLEAGAASLEESLGLWERGEALATRCETWLAGARARIDGRAGAGQGTDAGTDAGTDDTEDDTEDDPDVEPGD